MLTPELQEELMHLCWEYQYGTLSDRDAARLEKLVLQDDDARDMFVQYSGMCANLEWEGIVDPGPLGRSTDYDPLSSSELVTIPDYLTVPRTAPNRGKRQTIVLVCSLVVLVGLLFLFQFWFNPSPRFLARVVETQDAVWAEAQRHWSPEELLHAGDRIQLASGIVELETVTGAKVILKGKSQLTLTRPDRFELNQGNLFADVPPQSHGLTVETPTSQIVDLGTRFGLIVDSLQETEVHVLKGLVKFNLVNEAREVTASRNLTEQTAIRVLPQSREITKIQSTPELFVQSLTIEQPALVAHWKLSDAETSPIAHDAGEHQLNLGILDITGRSPFQNQPGPQHQKSAAGPFLTQHHKLYRRLSESEAALFHMDRFTIELWARNPVQDRKGDSDTLFHYRNVEQHDTSQFNLFSSDASGHLGFGFLATNGKYISYQLDRNRKWEKDRWYRIVFTYDANTAAPDDSIVTYSRTPEHASKPDIQQRFTNIKDITPLVPGGILAIGGSTLTDISRHWGGELSDVRFINGIPERYATLYSKSPPGNRD